MLRPVVKVHLRIGTQAVSGVIYFVFWLKGIDLKGSPLAGINEQYIGWSAAFSDKVCPAFPLSAGRCNGAIVIGESGEKPEREGGEYLKFIRTGFKLSK